ncbi:NAD(P)/FAD-dependent oxidoreductase [Nocardia sp. X0981]
MQNIVVVGASLAGVRAAEALRREGFTGSLTIIGDEPEMPYDRPPLSKEILRGEFDTENVVLPVDEGLGAVWKLGSPASELDTTAQHVLTADGERVSYDGLVIATGSRARTLPVFETDSPNVHYVRTLAAAHRLAAALRSSTRLLIVGCGFIGIEVASSARSRGVEVTVCGIDPPVSPAGPLASARATQLLSDAGVLLHIGHTVDSVEVVDNIHHVSLSNGSRIAADHIVVAVGAHPNTEWLAGAVLDTSDGVLCDKSLRVAGSTNIVAAGDVVRWPNQAFGGRLMRVEHWSNAVEQGQAAARTLLTGDAADGFGSIPSFWSDHFDLRLQSVGLPRLANRFEIVAGDPDERFCARAYLDDVLVGGVSYGLARPLASVRVELAATGVELPVSVA